MNCVLSVFVLEHMIYGVNSKILTKELNNELKSQ